MAKNNGHWYTDKNGNHYFVEDGQTPQEGWEASKRRKMISGGKYMTSEDGSDYSEVDRDKYEAYEADEADFDENEEDDFGFDEEDDFTQTVNEMKDDNVNLDDPREVMQYLGANMGLDREDQVRFMERLGYSVNDIEKLRNPGDDDDDDFDDNHMSYEEVFTDNDNAQIEKYAEHYGVDASELKDRVHQLALDYIRDGGSVTDAKNDAMEEVLDEVANGEYDREMKKAQEENARLSEGKDAPKNNPQPENDDPIYSHFRNKFGVSDKDLEDLRGYDYDRSKYKDNSKLTWKDPIENWADPVKDFAKEHNVSEDDVREFLNRAYDRTNKGPLKDGTDVYGSQQTGTQVFNNLKKYVDSLPDDQKEMLKDLLNNPRK